MATNSFDYIVASNHGECYGESSGIWLSTDRANTWIRKADGNCYFGPAISEDGRIIVGNNYY